MESPTPSVPHQKDYCVPFLDNIATSQLALFPISIRGQTFEIWDIKDSDTPQWVERDMNESAYGLSDLMGLKTIVDIGANTGIFSIYCAKVFPDSTIYAYEPFQINFDNLVRNLEHNQIKNVIPIQMAVTGNGRNIGLACPVNNSGSASFFHGINITTPNTPSITLDALIEPLGSVDLLKIDIESLEYEVLWMFNQWTRVNNLSVELHGLFPYPKGLWQDALEKFASELRSKPIRGKLWINDLNRL